jgi:hypothetical protein
VRKDADQFRNHEHHQRHDDRHGDTEQDERVDHRHAQLLAGVLTLLGVVRELLEDRSEKPRVLAGGDHGAIHFAEKTWGNSASA